MSELLLTLDWALPSNGTRVAERKARRSLASKAHADSAVRRIRADPLRRAVG
jgi:hypothetical protein